MQNNIAKTIFISLEIISLCAVAMFSHSTSIEHHIQATFTTVFALIAIYCQYEQQVIEWSNEDEMDSQIQSYIDRQQDMGR